MKHTVIALFDSADTARRAAEKLRNQGFAETSIHAGTTAPAADAHPLPAASAIEGGPASGLLHRLAVLFGVDDEPHIDHYAEAVRRGGSLVHVEARDEAQATAARDALLALGAANIDDRVDEWQQRGWRARLGPDGPSRSAGQDRRGSGDVDRGAGHAQRDTGRHASARSQHRRRARVRPRGDEPVREPRRSVPRRLRGALRRQRPQLRGVRERLPARACGRGRSALRRPQLGRHRRRCPRRLGAAPSGPRVGDLQERRPPRLGTRDG